MTQIAALASFVCRCMYVIIHSGRSEVWQGGGQAYLFAPVPEPGL